jgi:hypothetical protein
MSAPALSHQKAVWQGGELFEKDSQPYKCKLAKI